MENNPTYLFVVAAALIDEGRRVLVQKRPEGKPMAGLWEFPGGKIENDETPEKALVRELFEELNLKVAEKNVQPFTFASEKLGEKHLMLFLYVCDRWEGIIEEHEAEEVRWVTMPELERLEMPPADIPLVKRLSLIMQN